jgi:hypothetical protein
MTWLTWRPFRGQAVAAVAALAVFAILLAATGPRLAAQPPPHVRHARREAGRV